MEKESRLSVCLPLEKEGGIFTMEILLMGA
jgi:hypothetical protein